MNHSSCEIMFCLVGLAIAATDTSAEASAGLASCYTKGDEICHLEYKIKAMFLDKSVECQLPKMQPHLLLD